MTDPNASSSEPLQFDRAVDAEATAPDAAEEAIPSIECSACNSAIKTYYYHVDGATVCAKCKQVAERAGQSQRGGGALIKAFLLGGVAAVIGAAIYYGVIAITNHEIGFVAILIGFMVGVGVRMGAAGGGGRRYQVMALVLTYFAVGLAYTAALKGAVDAGSSGVDSMAVAGSLAADSAEADALAEEAAEEDSAEVALAGDADSSAAAPLSVRKIGLGTALLGLGVIVVGGFLMVFALPVISVLSSLPFGLINAFIIGLGMYQAWKMTAGHIVSVTGPYKVGGETEAAPPAATLAPEPAT